MCIMGLQVPYVTKTYEPSTLRRILGPHARHRHVGDGRHLVRDIFRVEGASGGKLVAPLLIRTGIVDCLYILIGLPGGRTVIQ